MMFDEGPGGGHYQNMTGRQFRRMGLPPEGAMAFTCPSGKGWCPMDHKMLPRPQSPAVLYTLAVAVLAGCGGTAARQAQAPTPEDEVSVGYGTQSKTRATGAITSITLTDADARGPDLFTRHKPLPPHGRPAYVSGPGALARAIPNTNDCKRDMALLIFPARWLETLVATLQRYPDVVLAYPLTQRVDSAGTSLAYSGIAGFVGLSLLMPFVWQPATLHVWMLFLLLGISGGLGHYFVIKAFEAAPGGTLAPFIYVQMLWMLIVGFIWFRDWPAITTWIGIALIVGSGLYALHRERIRAREKARISAHS